MMGLGMSRLNFMMIKVMKWTWGGLCRDLSEVCACRS